MKVLFFGDSICFGQKISPHKIWVTRISRMICDMPGTEDLVVVNSSVNGNTTRMALERIPADVQKEKPDIIFIQFGINDSHFWETDKGVPRVSSKAFETNLEEIIARARNFGASTIFLSTNHPTSSYLDYLNRKHNENNRKYNLIIRKVASNDDGVILIDMEKVFLDIMDSGTPLCDLLLPDGIHLSLKGHDLYVETVYPFIEKSVKKNG